ncbi:MAG: DNA helicase PcrA [Bacillota bacterium]
MQRILAGLNPAQQEAVTHLKGPLLILAGAGSGKTRVLTHRIAHLMSRGVPGGQILAVTFTNKAAEEMRQRVFSLIGEKIGDLWISTFHHACVRILRQEAPAVGFQKQFVIFDTDEQLGQVKQALKELNLDDGYFSPKAVLAEISKAKNELITADLYERRAADYFTRNVLEVYRLYQRRLAQQQAFDFDDLILQTVLLFRTNQGILEKYQDKFWYILIDEYQDTNHAQYQLVNLLAGKSRNLCVVGDDDQSIYGFRSADIRNILEFEKDYPEAKVIKLEQNYRSTKTILNAANEVIRHNRFRKTKRLWTENPGGEPVVLAASGSEKEEAWFIGGEIERLVLIRGLSFKDFAVLYRTNAQSRVLEEVFLNKGLPYRILAGLRFYDRKEIRDILAYLRLIYNPRDYASFRRIVNSPRRGIGEATVDKVASFVMEHGLGLDEGLGRLEEIPSLTGRAAGQLNAFGAMWNGWRSCAESESITALTSRVLDESGYVRQLEQEGTVEAQSRLENLKEFFSVIRDFEKNSAAPNLADFLEKVALVSDVDAYEAGTDAVVMMTLHTAKGLEFPVVFLAGMEEGLFPHGRSLFSEADLEEERRLCYVGITRAKNLLYLTYATIRTIYGKTDYTTVSRFIQDIPENLTVLPGTAPGYYGKRKTAPESPTEAAALRPGDRVRHAKWGEGTVVAVKGEGDGATLSLAFPDLGIKQVVAAYAPLEKIT